MTPTLLMRQLLITATANAIAGALTGSEIHLFQNSIVFNPDTTLIGDLVEADYDGYAALALTWGAASVSDDGHVETIASAQTWRPTGGTTPNQIYGFYIDDGAGVLLAGGTFDEGPYPMNTALDVMRQTVVLRLDGTGYSTIVS